MSLSNLVPGDVPEGAEFGSPVASGHTDLIEGPGFMRGLLDEPLAGLDSFGSEENDSDDNDADLDDVAPPSWNLSQSAPSRGTGQPRPGPVLAAAPSPVAPVDERVPAPKHLPVAGSDPDISTSALPSPADESVGQKASNVSSRALMARLRGSRANFNLQVAITVVLTLIGVAEASWLGVRAARGLSGMMRDGAEWPSATGGDSTSRQTMAGSGSEVLVSVHSTLPATRPPSPKVPGWVSISTPAPVEVLERGRVIGASWNGGVRLAPGRHDVRLLNRAGAIDVEQSLDIAPGSTTSVVVEYVSGALQETPCPRGQCESAQSRSTAPR